MSVGDPSPTLALLLLSLIAWGAWALISWCVRGDDDQSHTNRAVPASRSAQATARALAAQDSARDRQAPEPVTVAQSAAGSLAASSARHSRVEVHDGQPDGRGETAQHSIVREQTASKLSTQSCDAETVSQASTPESVGAGGGIGAHERTTSESTTSSLVMGGSYDARRLS